MITLLEWIAFFIFVGWAWKKYKEHKEKEEVRKTLEVGAGISLRK